MSDSAAPVGDPLALDRIRRAMEQGLGDARTISRRDLAELTLANSRLLRTLELLRLDLEVLKRERTFVHALDFSEIFAFLWPERVPSATRHLVRRFIDSPCIKFTVLPGALHELIRKVRGVVGSAWTERQGFERFSQGTMVAAFLRAFERTPSKAGELILQIPAVADALGRLRETSRTLARLDQLFRHPNLVPLEQLIADCTPGDLQLDVEIFEKAYALLDLQRPGDLWMNNFVDAHNFALVHLLTARQASQGSSPRVYHLVTSSPIPYRVLRNIPFDQEAALSDLALQEPASLIRHTLSACYFAVALECEDGRDRKLGKLYRAAKYLGETWGRLQRKRTRRSRASGDDERVQLPRGRKYAEAAVRFRAEYDRLFSGVLESVRADYVTEINYRRLRAVAPFSLQEGILGADATDSAGSSGRVVDLFEAVTRDGIRQLKRLEDGFSRLPAQLTAVLDTQGLLGRPTRLEKEVRRNAEFGCRELVVWNGSRRSQYLAADLYSTFLAVWWPTGAVFTAFMAQCAAYVAAVRRAGLASDTASREKEYSGFYACIADRAAPLHVPLDECPDFDPDTLLLKIGPSPVHTIRVATEVGDLFYDFGGYGRLPQRMGLTTHVAHPMALSRLICSANQVRLPISRAIRVVRDLLGEWRAEKGGRDDKSENRSFAS